uniref:Uncharacterized protein n=1 Tax=Eutreptiella gymnastica TaxID=73025 RepID=A0A7S1IFS8_9EUGL|mmetsp:Transcript_152959/g.267295  ORF Transcript_152959/g.267295 Transcript_152959/m.267295 type:complete len:797 (+) Transcript_152959:119-2509(+)
MKDLRPLTRTPSANPANRFAERRQIRSAGAVRSAPDAAMLAVLKSDVLSVQRRIDTLSIDRPPPGITHTMQQQEKLMLSLMAGDDEDEVLETKAKLLEHLLTKVHELSTALAHVVAKAGVVAPFQEGCPLFTRQAAEEAMDMAALRRRPPSAAEYNPRGGGPPRNPTPPIPLSMPYGKFSKGHGSFIDVFLALSDALAAISVEGYDCSKTTPVDLDAEKNKAVDALRSDYEQQIKQLIEQHAIDMSKAEAEHDLQMKACFGELEDLQMQMAGAAGKDKKGVMEKTAKDIGAQLKELQQENDTLLRQLDSLKAEMEAQKINEAEATYAAFGGVLDTKLMQSLGFNVEIPEASKPTDNGDARYDGRRGSLMSNAGGPPNLQLGKGKKGTDENETAKLMKQLEKKVEAYSSTLKRQNQVLHEVQNTLPGMMQKRDNEVENLHTEIQNLQQRVAVLIDDRDTHLAKTRKSLRDKQAEVICLRAELNDSLKEQKSQLQLVEEDHRAMKSLPILMTPNRPAPITVVQKMNHQTTNILKLEQQLAESMKVADRAERQVDSLTVELSHMKQANEQLKTQVRALTQQTAEAEWTLEMKSSELEDAQAKLKQTVERMQRNADASGLVYERSKRMELQLHKANDTIEALGQSRIEFERSVQEDSDRKEQETSRLLSSKETARGILEEALRQKDKDLQWSETKLAQMKEQCATTKDKLKKTAKHALDLFELGTLLMSIQFSVLNPLSQDHKASALKAQLVGLGQDLTAMHSQVDDSWLAHISALQNERRWLESILDGEKPPESPHKAQ